MVWSWSFVGVNQTYMVWLWSEMFLFIPHGVIKSFFGMNKVPFFGIFQIIPCGMIFTHVFSWWGGNEVAAFLCTTLEQHGEQPGTVLRRACLAGAEWNEPASVTALLFMAAQKHFPSSVPSDTDDDDDTDYDAAAAYESDDSTWVSFTFVGSVQGYLDLVSLLLFSLSPPFHVEGTSLTTSLRYQDSRLIFKSA
jgi:hypothetical protein